MKEIRVRKFNRGEYEVPDTKIVLVVRIPTLSSLPKEMNEQLKDLGLETTMSATILRFNEETHLKLRALETFVAWGVPTLATVQDLVQKLGTLYQDGERQIISDNTIVEQQLGEYGVLCLQDIVHEIFTAGDAFDAVMSALGSFQLERKKYDEKGQPWVFMKSEQYGRFGGRGFCGADINGLVADCI